MAALDACNFVINGGPIDGEAAAINREIVAAARSRGLPVLRREDGGNLTEFVAAIERLQSDRIATTTAMPN